MVDKKLVDDWLNKAEEDFGCAVASLEREACLFLNRFYIESRYPVHWPLIFYKYKIQLKCYNIVLLFDMP